MGTSKFWLLATALSIKSLIVVLAVVVLMVAVLAAMVGLVMKSW